MAYTYNASKVAENGKDRMRFELGDVMVEGGAETCALTDEEYEAVLSKYNLDRNWKRAKLDVLQAIVFRFAYEVDTKVGSLTLSLAERYKRWKAEFDELKDELEKSGAPLASPRAIKKPPYFRTGIHDNRQFCTHRGGNRHVY